MSETVQTTPTGLALLPAGGSFEGGVTDVLRTVRATFAAVIAALPGGIAKAADLQRALKIDMKLSWKIFKVLNATDPLLAGPHVPGPANVATFLKAAAKHRVNAALIEGAEQAASVFQDFVQAHAGERAAFDSMVSALGNSEVTGSMLLQHMRAAFRANRHLWGVQAKTQLRCVIVQPAAQPDMLSLAIVQGYARLRRLRTQAPLVISRARITDNDGTLREVARQPIDPAGATEHGISLIREFCSQPLPQFRTAQGSAGFVYGEMISNGVGNRAAVTCIDGHMTPLAGPRYRDERNQFLRASVRVRIPCEVLVCDLLVRAGTVAPPAPTVGIYADDLSGGPGAGQPQERDRLGLQESVTYLGRGPSVLHTPDVPRYTDLARYVFTRLGWEGNAFDVFRCRIEYPVMASTVRIALELAERPTA